MSPAMTGDTTREGAAGPPGWPATAVALAVVLACACTPSSAEDPAAVPAESETARQALLTINHLAPRPDFVGAQPARFAWTPIAGVDSYAIGLVNEIDMVVWQTSGIATAEVAWPATLDVPEGTYFWMVEGYRDGRRVAESGRAAFVVER
jgi:hypothetical protein